MAEALDAALRGAFFLDQRNLSLRTVLLAVAGTVPGLDPDALREAYDSGRARRALLQQYEAVCAMGVQGIPTVCLPGGERVGNPGLTTRWARGIPYVLAEDRTVYEQLLRAAIGCQGEEG
jgi:predicted DsbA family dithiol-disulfide isomerase